MRVTSVRISERDHRCERGVLLGDDRAGEMIEFDETDVIFTRPKDSRTEDYVTGRFG